MTDRLVVGPRVAGAALMAVSTAAGVFYIIFVSSPQWGVPAAIVLAFSSVGFLVGLLTAQRKNWADRTWPPGGRARSWSPQRARRMMLLSGAFVLVVSVTGACALVITGSGADSESARSWVLIGAFALLGVTFVVSGARPVPDAVDSSARPDDLQTVDDGWLRVDAGGSLASQGWATATIFPFQAPMLMIAFLPILLRAPLWLMATVVAGVAVIVMIAFVIARRPKRSPFVARDGSAIRRGATESPAPAITAANLFWAPWTPNATERSLTITFAGAEGFRATVALRTRGHLALSRTATTALVELVMRSSIELPRDREDPRGRFSRVLYPTHLTKSEALAVIEHPPGDGEALPVAAAPPAP